MQYVEDLGGCWAPNSDYGVSIMRDYIKNLYNTPTPREEDMLKALQLSDRVDELLEEDTLEIMEVIAEYNNLTDSQKALVPYNIKEKIERLR